MPINAKKFDETVTHQAVCTKCNFSGTRYEDPEDAESEAASHCSKTGNANHIVKIITTAKKVRTFEIK
jgi:hypothetical protein